MERQDCGGFGGCGNGRHEKGECKDRDNLNAVASNHSYVEPGGGPDMYGANVSMIAAAEVDIEIWGLEEESLR